MGFGMKSGQARRGDFFVSVCRETNASPEFDTITSNNEMITNLYRH